MRQEGYGIIYFNNRLSTARTAIVFSKKTEKCSGEICDSWIKGDFSHDGHHRIDYFVNVSGYYRAPCFAALTSRKIPGEDYDEHQIRFVAETAQKLKHLTDAFGLPFNEKKVFPTFDLKTD